MPGKRGKGREGVGEPGVSQEEKSIPRSPGRSNVAVISSLFLTLQSCCSVIWATEKYPSKGSCLVTSPKRNLLQVGGERGTCSGGWGPGLLRTALPVEPHSVTSHMGRPE